MESAQAEARRFEWDRRPTARIYRVSSVHADAARRSPTWLRVADVTGRRV